MLIDAKCKISPPSEEALVSMADLIYLLALDHSQQAKSARSKGRQKPTPEITLHDTADKFAAALLVEINAMERLGKELAAKNLEEAVQVNYKQIVAFTKLLTHIAEVKNTAFPPIEKGWGNKWGADAILLLRRYQKLSGVQSLSKQGPAARFILLALKSIGWSHVITLGAIEASISAAKGQGQ